ncbi:MAG: hypothetical protein M3Q99_18520 [Acidobacteriota bacterium]|nr:hypothetical protein [Acidobacteriota bacterium]
MKIISKILAILLILAAIYTFDLHNFNSWVVSILLFMSALLELSQNEKFNESIRKFRLLLLIFLILKLLITG